MAVTKVTFAPRWKEELVCTMDGRQFVIELTMGELHAYLPSKEVWARLAPDWARGQWARVHQDLTTWCQGQSIPLTVEERAWVSFV